MKSFDELLKYIDQKIAEYFNKATLSPDELYEPVKYTMHLGGKRIRPVLVLMAYNLYKEDFEKAINAALAVEIYHNFTLLHDDVMDNSLVRRNQPTVHVKWNTNTAILSGDAMLIIAYQLLANCEPDQLSSLLNVFNQVSLEVCEGQQLDLNYETRMEVTESEYIEMIRLKTSVLLAASLKLGAISALADKKDQESLYQFGENLGIAFQLQDDYLDVYGDIETFGKRIGGDIVSNKKTYMLIKALQLAENETKSELHDWISSTNFDEQEKIRKVTEIYNHLGIADLAKSKIKEFHQKALLNLGKVKVADDKKKALIDLAESLMKREK